MFEQRNGSPGVPGLRQLAGIGSRAAEVTLRPMRGAAVVAMDAGITFQRRVVDRALDSPEVERLIIAVIDSPRIDAAIQGALSGAGGRRLIDAVFDSGVIDHFVDRLLASPALGRIVDEVAASSAATTATGPDTATTTRESPAATTAAAPDSPAVTTATAQQGLGLADQVGAEVRSRSRNTDDWLQRAARRLARRRDDTAGAGATQPLPGTM